MRIRNFSVSSIASVNFRNPVTSYSQSIPILPFLAGELALIMANDLARVFACIKCCAGVVCSCANLYAKCQLIDVENKRRDLWKCLFLPVIKTKNC